ncbi:MAG TPA: D-alanyl-D-alanine carboxypeptidase/D-alanyl-D-alanine-endopeptidase [Actinomycetota bacterium]|nr:D-alanyl-D-alanine carboxypeptidase/D-alanyl-D-alanine-endopeptidase [Actinomycetota bacterium]
MLHRRTARALSVLALIVFLAPANSSATEATARRRAQALLSRVVATRAAAGSLPGLVIVRDNRTLASRNSGVAMRPASLMKLFVTTAAMIKFGPDHRFTTRVTGVHPDIAGVVGGHLTLVGGGDPTLATHAYRSKFLVSKRGFRAGQTIFTEHTATIERLAARVFNAGVRRVSGDLVVDDFLFDARRIQAGWRSSYLNTSTGGPHVGLITALPVNEGFANLRRTAVTRDPAGYAGALFRRALAARGIAIDGVVRRGRAAPGAATLARYESPRLVELTTWTNRWSENYPAEILLKSLGAAFGDRGTTAEGARVVRSTLTAAGIDVSGLSIHDGSGLSLYDRATPRSLASLIRFVLRDDISGARLRPGFPVARRPGTLLLRTGLDPVRGNLRGKTGLITGVRGMAGWVTASDGRVLVYVGLFNRARSPLALTPTLDMLGVGLHRVT